MARVSYTVCPRRGRPGFLTAEALEAAEAVLGFSVDLDCWAARQALLHAAEAAAGGRLLTRSEVCGRLRGRRVCVAGSAATLRRDLRAARGCEAYVAADGATALLLEEGIVPDVVATDMDGPWAALWRAAELGAATVVYVHGDNYPLLPVFVQGLPVFALELQCLPPRLAVLGLAMPTHGFSDGDRAVALAACCGAAGLELLGFDASAPQAGGTKPWLRGDSEPGPVKRVKLRVASLLAAAVAAAAGMVPR